jgi:hypothetical protein
MDGKSPARLTCELFCESDSTHLQQIYTGFWMLQEQGVIHLRQRLCKKNRSARAYLEVVVDGSCRLAYDTHDSFEIDPQELARVDVYLKRSYADSFVATLPYKEKVRPLGLNFGVYAAGYDCLLLRRAALQERKLLKFRNVSLGFGLDRIFGGRLYVDRADKVGVYPDTRLPAQIIYMTRAFDPMIGRSQEKREEIENLNATRAQYIRSLRAEFGKSFTGGFAHEDYAVTKFRDCLVTERALATKYNYMKTLTRFPIGVATTGLHGSIGWKLAEYVAYGMAIVSEKLNYRVPGSFEAGRHYLESTTPQDCVDAAAKLVHDRDLRVAMMIRNHRYYESHVRPDALVRNSLAIAAEALVSPAMRSAACEAPLGQPA